MDLIFRMSYLCKQPSCVPARTLTSDVKQHVLNAADPATSNT